MHSQPSSSKRQCTFNEKMAPWHDDYEPVGASRLEKYMDRDIFADYLECVEDEREAKREEKRRREEKMVRFNLSFYHLTGNLAQSKVNG